MMRPYTYVFALLAPVASWAQPNLGAGSVNPVPGDQLEYSYGDFAQPGAGGANVTWDQTGLSTSNPNTFNYVTVASTSVAASFPQATVAQDEGSGDYLFYRATADGYSDDGFHLTTSGYTGTCSDPSLLVAYPLTYGGTFTDQSTCSVTDGNTTWARTTDVSGIADGWGDLQLSWGTVSNVLRVRNQRTMVDNQLSPATTTTFDDYFYYRPGVHGPVLVLERITIDFGGFILSDSSSSVIGTSTIGVEELLRHDIGMELWPNPATDRVEVTFGLAGGQAVVIDVLDLHGQVVRNHARNTRATGLQREVIDIAGLTAGVYLVRITDGTGALGMRRLVKH